jgi:hypothetical protein
MLPAVVPKLDLNLVVAGADAPEVLELQVLHASLAAEVVVVRISGEGPGAEWQTAGDRGQTNACRRTL